MFTHVTLHTANKKPELCFDANKTYLLMMAQNYDTHLLPPLPKTTTIYTITVPAVIWKATLYEDALICCELASQSHILFCKSERDAPEITLRSCQTLLMFVDWMDKSIYRYLDKLFSLTGGDVTIMGVGCGRTDEKILPLMTCDGVELKNGFIVLFSDIPSSVGSSHGSQFHDGYYIARTEQSNHIVTINGENAFDFYAKLLKHHFHEEVNETNIFAMGLKYPLGLGGMGAEQPLRVPSRVENGALVVAGPMDEESTLCLMHSTPQSLLKAHSIAIESARGLQNELLGKSCFIIECVGRNLVLGNDFSQELEAIVEEMSSTSHQYGVLSLGEIANSAEKYIEYFNESCVIGLINESQ